MWKMSGGWQGERSHGGFGHFALASTPNDFAVDHGDGVVRAESSVLSGVGWVITGRLPGAVIGVALLTGATQAILQATIAVLVLIAVAILATGLHVRRTPATQFGAGLFSGVSGLVASIGGRRSHCSTPETREQ